MMSLKGIIFAIGLFVSIAFSVSFLFYQFQIGTIWRTESMHLQILLAMTSSYKSCTVLSNRKPYFTAINRGKTNLHYFFPHFSCRSILAGFVFHTVELASVTQTYSNKKKMENERKKKRINYVLLNCSAM